MPGLIFCQDPGYGLTSPSDHNRDYRNEKTEPTRRVRVDGFGLFNAIFRKS